MVTMQSKNNADSQMDMGSKLAQLMLSVLERDDELFSFFGSSRYSLLLLVKLLLSCENSVGLSKEECLCIGRDLRSRTHRQNVIDEAVQRGFFAKEPSTTDARQVVIYPTAKTKHLFKEWVAEFSPLMQ